MLQVLLGSLPVGVGGLQRPDLLVGRQLLQEQGVAGGDGLDLAEFEVVLAEVAVECGVLLVQFSAGPDLVDEAGLPLDGLPHEGVEGAGLDPAVDLDRDVQVEVLVVLPDDPPFALGDVRGPPRAVDVMECEGAVLDVDAHAHGLGGADQDRHFAQASVREQGRLLLGVLRVLGEPDLVDGHTPQNQFVPQVLVSHELAQLAVAVGGGAPVGEDELQGPGQVGGVAVSVGVRVVLVLVVDRGDLVGRGVELPGAVGLPLDHAQVHGGHAPVVADLEEVVVGGVDHAVADQVGPEGDVLHERAVLVRGRDHDGLADAFGHGHVDVVLRLDVRHRPPRLAELESVAEGPDALLDTRNAFRGDLRCDDLGEVLRLERGERRDLSGYQEIGAEVVEHHVCLRHRVGEGSSRRAEADLGPERLGHGAELDLQVFRLGRDRQGEFAVVRADLAVGEVLDLVDRDEVDAGLLPRDAAQGLLDQVLLRALRVPLEVTLQLLHGVAVRRVAAAGGGGAHRGGGFQGVGDEGVATWVHRGGQGVVAAGQYLVDAGPVLGCLVRDELRLATPGHRNPLEQALGEDDRVPVAVGYLGDVGGGGLLGELAAVDGQDPGPGVRLEEVVPEVVDGRVLHHDAGLADHAQPLHLHQRHGDGEGLAESDLVVQEAPVGLGEDAGDAGPLVRAGGDRVRQAGEGQVASVALVGDEAVEQPVVVGQDGCGAVGVLPEPVREQPVELVGLGDGLLGLVGRPPLGVLDVLRRGVLVLLGRMDHQGGATQQAFGEFDGVALGRAVHLGRCPAFAHGGGRVDVPVGSRGAGDGDVAALQQLLEELLVELGGDPGHADLDDVDVAGLLVRRENRSQSLDVGLERVGVAALRGDEGQDPLRGFDLGPDVAAQVLRRGDQALAAGFVEDQVAERVTGFVEGVQVEVSRDLTQPHLAEGVEADGQGVLRSVRGGLGGLGRSDRAGEDGAAPRGLGVRVVDLQRVHAGGVRIRR